MSRNAAFSIRVTSVWRCVRMFFLMALLLFGLYHAGLFGRAAAESPAELWSVPTNLSRSGAASQPRIAVAPEGSLQAFWWDRFDGLTTSVRDEKGWSAPVVAPIVISETVGVQPRLRPIAEMPTLLADHTGEVHALWLDQEDRETHLRPLMHSRLTLGKAIWTSPEVVAESALTYTLAAAPSGGLVAAYVRPTQDITAPAGIYIRRWTPEAGWGATTLVYPSIYFRLLSAEEAYIRLAVGDKGELHLAWVEPRSGQALYAYSPDGGAGWTPPETLGRAEDRPARPRVVALPKGGALRMWEGSHMGLCTLYQQALSSVTAPSSAPTATPSSPAHELTRTEIITVTLTGTPTPAPALMITSALSLTWAGPQRILDGLRACPQGDRFWAQGERLFWLWGEGTAELTMLAWDAERGRWSEPRSLDLRLRNPETQQWLALSDLHAAVVGDKLMVVGADAASGEVWFTECRISALELAFAPPSPWSTPQRLQQWPEAGWPAVAVDGEGRVHVVWTEPGSGGAGTALMYARWDGTRWSPAIGVTRDDSGQELLRQPALVADANGLLHLAWSGGNLGQILYARARADQAATAGWSEPVELSAPTLAGSWPQMGLDLAGRLYLVYAVPLNEGRGVYLLHSEDGGESWSPPELIFDAVAAGWPAVDHPALAVAADGTLHVAWVKGSLPGAMPPQGIYYTRSTGGPASHSWADPERLADPGYDWPRLALLDGQVHLVYAKEADGSVWHRWADGTALEGGAQAWSVPARVPGWQGMAAPVGLSSAGRALYLVGLDEAEGTLRYSVWDSSVTSDSGAPRWSTAETVWLGPEVAGGLGAQAALPPQGGRLAVALRILEATASDWRPAGVLAMVRAVPTVDAGLLPTRAVTPQPTATPSPTPVPTPLPSPTPDLGGPQPSTSPSRLLALLGGGLAGVIVLAALGVRAAWVRRR